MKRFTIELDDSPDQRGQTVVPGGEALPVQYAGFKTRQLTGVPSAADSEDGTISPIPGQVSPKAPGRTVSDLVAEFMNNPQVMATLLVFAPFPFFASSIKGLADLAYPAITGGLLNLVWFGMAWFRKRSKGSSP